MAGRPSQRRSEVGRWRDNMRPHSGNGAFAYALVDTAITTGIEVDDKMLSRLYLLEQQPKFLRDFEAGFRLKYQGQFPKRNLIQCDIILSNPKRRFDFLVGNPPWANFNDLPPEATSKQPSHSSWIRFGPGHAGRAFGQFKS